MNSTEAKRDRWVGIWNRHIGIWYDDPADVGCRGFVLRIGRLRLSLTWQVRGE